MSRIGKKPVAVPAGVTAALANGMVEVRGPKGVLMEPMLDLIEYRIEDGQVSVKPRDASRQARAFWGMSRTKISNLVVGVTQGFTKTLDITGVGYRAMMAGAQLKLQLGYSHDVMYDIPEGITIKTPDANTVEVSGADKQKVGQVAAEIRRWRKPEPYKGKGIKYRGEFIFRKEGKKK